MDILKRININLIRKTTDSGSGKALMKRLAGIWKIRQRQSATFSCSIQIALFHTRFQQSYCHVKFKVPFMNVSHHHKASATET